MTVPNERESADAQPRQAEQTIGGYDPIIPASPEPAPVQNDPVIPASREATATAPTVRAEQEKDAWWGGFSAWTMLPSWILASLTSGLLWWGAVIYIEDELVFSLCQVFAIGVFLFQGFRWAYRYFGFTYRMTTRRLFMSRGLLYGRGTEMDLATVVAVTPFQNALERLLGVGRVTVTSEDKTQPPIILEGMSNPKLIAELILSQSRQAHENGVQQSRVSATQSPNS